MIIGIHHDGGIIEQRLKYVIEYLNGRIGDDRARFLLNPEKCDQSIYYGSKKEDGFFIPRQDSFFKINLQKPGALHANAFSFEALTLFSVEREKKEVRPFLNQKQFGFDLFECIFFHLSRWEEYLLESESIDHHKRMKAKSMFLVTHHLEKKPVVDHLVYALFKSLGLVESIPLTKVGISHDIDQIRLFNGVGSYWKKMIGSMVRGKWHRLPFLRRSIRSKKDPYDRFEEMLIDNDLGENGKMIFYLMGGKTSFDTKGPSQDPIFLKSLALAQKRGYVVGSHPSYASLEEPDLILSEKEELENAIGEKVKINRQHYLRFRFPETMRELVRVGIKVDSSLGFTDRLGYRCGTGFPFRMYDLEKDQVLELVQIPLVFMDSALIRESEGADDRMHRMIQLCNSFLEANKYFTRITFNFHNSRFADSEMEGYPIDIIYEKALAFADRQH